MVATERTLAVSGFWHANAGSLLMALTLQRKAAELGVADRLAVPTRRSRLAEVPHARTLLLPNYAGNRLRNLASTALGALPQTALSPLGLVRPDAALGLVDLSGFAISDQWGPSKAEERSQRAVEFASRYQPVLFLPQSAGPFEDPRVRTAFVAAVSAARRFFVRDEASLEHAERSGADMSKVTSAPDVTFDCVVPPPQDAVPDLILVPNERLVTPETGSVEVVTYVDLMIQLGQIGRQLGRKARVVVHGGSGGDLDLASRIASALECRVELLGPIAFKSSVGDRSVVVASRFHALLSSLAQGASAMALGWSHKYPMLMDQFGLSEFNTTPSKALSTPERLMGDLDDHARSGAQRIVAQEQVREARARLTDVWAELASFSSDVNNP